MRYLICALGLATAALAQTPAATRPAPSEAKPAAAATTVKPAAAPAPSVIRWKGITITGSLRSRVEAFDWFQPDATSGPGSNNAYAYSGNIFRISFAQRRETWDWNAEFAVPMLYGLPSNSVAPGAQGALGPGAQYWTGNQRSTNAAMIFPKQLYVRFNRMWGSANHSLRLGRFEFSDGAELTPKNGTLATLKNTRIAQRMIGSFGWTDVGRSFDGLQ